MNVRTAIEGTDLVIRVDLRHRGGLSSSGKTILIATASEKIASDLAPDCRFGLNVFVPAASGVQSVGTPVPAPAPAAPVVRRVKSA